MWTHEGVLCEKMERTGPDLKKSGVFAEFYAWVKQSGERCGNEMQNINLVERFLNSHYGISHSENCNT